MPDPRLDRLEDPIAEPLPGEPAPRPARPPNHDPVAESVGDSETNGRDIIAWLDAEIAKLAERASDTAREVRLALAGVVGKCFHQIKKEERAEFIAKIRLLLLKSDYRIVCPECEEPSLPYFLPHTKEGTVQLQHKHATPSAHVIYGTRGGKLSFPTLVLVRVEFTESEK